MSWNLANSFLRGRDCDTVVNDECQGDSVRDVRVDNVGVELSAWITDTVYTTVTTRNYPHAGYQGAVATIDTPDRLNSAFANYTCTTPTIL